MRSPLIHTESLALQGGRVKPLERCTKFTEPAQAWYFSPIAFGTPYCCLPHGLPGIRSSSTSPDAASSGLAISTYTCCSYLAALLIAVPCQQSTKHFWSIKSYSIIRQVRYSAVLYRLPQKRPMWLEDSWPSCIGITY